VGLGAAGRERARHSKESHLRRVRERARETTDKNQIKFSNSNQVRDQI
jgi:hypothetical protein